MTNQINKQAKYSRQMFLYCVALTAFALASAYVATHIQTLNWPERYRYESLMGSIIITMLIAPICGTIVYKLLVRNQRLLTDLNRLANYDDLTGLCNRREFFCQATKRLGYTKRSVVLLADIDWFKKVNDTFGHAAGDEALRHTATVMKKSLPSDGLLARLGGEEFAVMFAFTTIGEARNHAEKLRLNIFEAPFIIDGKHIPLSISIGLAVSDENEDIGGLLARADEALYRAKHAGRNQTLLAA